jgi:prepilin-type N-terminal cleavage/methylation domain-containing protein
MRPYRLHGFTLIEISIVLVIIGLLVGGVLVGKSLIEASRLRAQISQFEQFDTAANTFRNKYNCLPGDCPNASSFGLSGIISATDTPSDGNGDKVVNCIGLWGGGCGNMGENVGGENSSFWQHMANAKLVAPMIYSTSLNFAQPGQLVTLGLSTPRPKLSNGGSNVTGGGIAVINTAIFNAGSAAADQMPFNNIYYVGYHTAILGGVSGMLRGADVHSLDMKLDDGYPSTGTVRSIMQWTLAFNGSFKYEHHALNTCVNTAPTPDVYVDSQIFDCIMEIKANF